ncbi:MAG: sensor histidine kinase and response regulator of a two component complex, partial [Frankiales bacterium]|nr:sensor histidine kinase and response regulator of a two component complex [Frankiales bacterium]
MPGESHRSGAVARAAAAAAARDHGLHDLVRSAADVLAADFGFLTLVHDDVEEFVCVAGPLSSALPPTLPVGESVCRLVVESGQPLLVPDLSLHPELRDLAEVRVLGLRSYAGAPVSGEDVVLGSFCVGSGSPRTWTGREADLLTGLARAVSSELRLLVALQELERVQALEREHAEEQAALHRVATAVARGGSSSDVLHLVATELAGLLGARGAAVVRF